MKLQVGRAARKLACICFALWLLAPIAQVVQAVPLLSNVSFTQADWYGTDGSTVPDSLWGAMTYQYAPQSTTTYLNVVASNSLTGTVSWIIKNAPLVSDPDFPQVPVPPRSERIDINLSDLGMQEGEDWQGVFYEIRVEDQPISTWSSSPTDWLPVNPAVYRFASPDAPGMAPAAPGAPLGIKNESKIVKQSAPRKFASVEEDDNTCCAGAFARSIDWLNQKHALGINTGAQDIYKRLREAGVSVDDPGKFDFPDWIKEKNDWVNDQSRRSIVTKVWDSGNILPPISGVPESTGDFLQWLQNEIDRGEDVEVAHYTSTGAHIVTISDYMLAEDGTVIVHYHDDTEQGKAGGDGGVAKKVVLTQLNGKYYFGSNSQQIYAAVSESVPEPPVHLLLIVGLIILLLHDRGNAASPSPLARGRAGR